MGSVKQLQSLLFPALISLFLTALHASATSNISLPGCPDKCGKISVPYPFGIGTGCYRDGFEITCNESKIRPRLFLWSEQENNIEVTNINITSGEAYANNKYFSYLCTNKTISKQVGVIFTLKFRGAFLLSHQRNKFIVIGCRAFAYFVGVDSELRENWSGCLSFCDSLNSTTGDGGQCNGSGCCTSTVAAGLYKYTMGWGHEMGTLSEVNPCNYAVLMDENWYKFSLRDLSGLDFYERNYKIGVPVVLDWAIRDVNGTCRNGVERSPNPACRSNHSSCHLTSNGNGYLCQCKQGYNGNPYLHGGCIDIDECNSTKENPCSKNAICTNTIGNFTCSCPKGTHGNPHDKDGVCIKNPESFLIQLE
ncbi:Wall-associated kinase family protein [Rhynchospora pubera]|uniref:Wall-associated kinase family protein n=1 Tax=Rhynchospora pubera TaxID=906938 RepID=A0AAV8CXD1_9POAL|nr:Wall-associated kinase family protein [Rhynchospora pubera]